MFATTEPKPTTSSGPSAVSSSNRSGQQIEMRDKAYNICREFLSGSWKKIRPSDMVFKSVSGGLSNLLYYCSLPSTHTPLNGEPSQVLLRMYGQLHSSTLSPSPSSSSSSPSPAGQSKKSDLNSVSGDSNTTTTTTTTNATEQVLTTITDSVIFMLLSERKLGPKLYGIFPGGRLEEYIPARAMTCQELRDPMLSAIIARKLANVHSLDVPINKEPTWLFTTMRSWLSTIQTRTQLARATGTSPESTGGSVARELLAFDFENEIKWLESFLKKVNSPVVFCHNDLQEGNILLPTEIQLTSTHNGPRKNVPQMYNNLHHPHKHPHKKPHLSPLNPLNQNVGKVVNHMRNNSGTQNIPCPSTSNTPTVVPNVTSTSAGPTSGANPCSSHTVTLSDDSVVLIDFEYCSYNYRASDIANHFCEWAFDYSNPEWPHFYADMSRYPNEDQRRHFIREYLKQYKKQQHEPTPISVSSEEVEKVIYETTHFTLASHLLWTLWAINNAQSSTIQFGYWEYGLVRLKSYLKQKAFLIDSNNPTHHRPHHHNNVHNNNLHNNGQQQVQRLP